MAKSIGIKSKQPGRLLRVFLCHSSGDKQRVRDLHHRLKADGVAPWFDEEDLVPGVRWEPQIEEAIRASDVVLICLSKHAVKKEGFVQKEIRNALEIAKEKPDGTIFLIPLRLDKCTVPPSLREFQWVDLCDPVAYDQRLLRALHMRAQDLGITLAADDAHRVAEICQKANQVVRDLPPALGARGTLTNVFRRLVAFDESGLPRKASAVFDPNDGTWTPEALQLLRALIDNGVLLSTRHGTKILIELAHESLIDNWNPMMLWVLDMRIALLAIGRVEHAAREWKNARLTAEAAQVAAVDSLHLWPQEKLDEVNVQLQLLDVIPRPALSADAQAFLRPECDRLIRELEADIGHPRRAEIGDRLEDLGDRRRGVGLRPGGLPDILWCPVPAGEVTIRDQADRVIGTFATKPFYIARYEVTARQFEVFTHYSVYNNPKWWTDLAVEPATHPPFPQKGAANFPAQFVSWYQAIAFCRWLSEVLHYAVRLPAEWEWVQAATGGNQDYIYPWGREWDPARANHRGGAYRLLAVGMYPMGTSPGGAFDMSGNMFEWCQNEFDSPQACQITGTAARTTRGGAFFSDPAEMSVRCRLRDNPSGTNDLGRRIGACIRLVADCPPPGLVTD